MNRRIRAGGASFLLAVSAWAVQEAPIYDIRPDFGNVRYLPPLAAGVTNAPALAVFGGHSGPYRPPVMGGVAVIPSTPDGRYRCDWSVVGQACEARKPDFRLGEQIEPPPGADLSVAPTVTPATSAFYVPSSRAVIAADRGLVRIGWRMEDGATLERNYVISAVAFRRPARLYWTEEPYNAPTVNLRDRFVRLRYNATIGQPEPDPNQTNQPMTRYLRGVWVDEQHLLHAKDVTGSLIIEYFETGSLERQVGYEIVEVMPPQVNVQRVTIGSRLRPLATYYGEQDLSADIRQGASTLCYKHATKTADGPKNGWVFAISRTADTPYQLEIYWKHRGLMEVEWPFEVDWYAADWPPDDGAQICVRGGGRTNAPVTLPRELNTMLEDFQQPPQHATLSNDADGNAVFSSAGPGHALLRYTADENVWFEVVRSVDHRDSDLFNPTPQPWWIGEEMVPVQTRTALSLEEAPELALPIERLAALTIEAWIYMVSAEDATVFVRHGVAEAGQRSIEVTVRDRMLSASAWSEGEAVPRQLAGGVLATKTWHHVAVILTTNGLMRLFLDGRESAAPVMVGSQPAGPVVIGMASQDGLPAFRGYLTGLRVWGRALEPEELESGDGARLSAGTDALRHELDFERVTLDSVFDRADGSWRPLSGGRVKAVPMRWEDLGPEWGEHPGYVHGAEGDRYNPRFYTYPAEDSAVFSVNTGVLEVWWWHKSRLEGLPAKAYWPCWVNRYESGWAPDVQEIVIAGQNTNPVGTLESSLVEPEVYYQNDRNLPGYNPNEEHAWLVSGKAYALRDDLNAHQTSLPYVLVQYVDGNTGRPGMRVFRVVETNAYYGFHQDLTAGTLVQPPMPLTVLPRAELTVCVEGPAWRDRKRDHWAMAAGADGASAENIVMRFFYAVQPGFWFPNEETQPAAGTEVPWLSRRGSSGVPIDYVYRATWPAETPVLEVGGTLAKARHGLPSIRGQTSVRVLYQQSEQQQPPRSSVLLFDPTQARRVPLELLPGDPQTEAVRGKTYFPALPPHLRNRLYYDPDAGELVLAGRFVEPAAGEPYLLLNVLGAGDRAVVSALSADPLWKVAVGALAEGVVEISDDEVPFDSLALSAALAGGTGYVTVAFNSSRTLNAPADPISLSVFRVEIPLYRGELKAVLSENPLDEQITLQHSGDFGGRPAAFEFEWRTLPPDASGMPPGGAPSTWTLWRAGRDVPRITLGGPGLMTLTDNYFVARYRPADSGGPTGTAWSEWTQPMLAEGWIKRALNGLNPFEQRLKDLQENRVNTTVSLIGQAGARWVGDVPLNLENINDVGLIEVYETILKRGRMLSIDAHFNYAPANDALLLAAGRIHDLYMLLGNEAYADAYDPTIAFSTSDREAYGALWTSLFCFMNQVPTLLDEELALLRGRDDSLQPSVHTYPFYNRLAWNFTKGIQGGEAAYALNYGIRNENQDPSGIINEEDARRLYPQGHGDAWGHYLTALSGYYQLLANSNFTWIPRIEAKLVGGVPVSVDYYDERKFAEAAAARARTGLAIFDRTHRQAYAQSPGARLLIQRDQDAERAWGVGEWGSRIGQGALFDWVVGNSLLPDRDTDPSHSGIQVIDRTTVPELTEMTSALTELQAKADHADQGHNPLGLDPGAVTFDLDLQALDAGKTHFEQVYDRALTALNSAAGVFRSAAEAVELMRHQSDALAALNASIIEAENDYTGRLIEIYGYPYADDIGPGRTYPDGYDGPDLYHFYYVDVPDLSGSSVPGAGTHLTITVRNYDFVGSPGAAAVLGGERVSKLLGLPLDQKSRQLDFYVTPSGLMAKPPTWSGRRRAEGELQSAYGAFLLAWYEVRLAEAALSEVLGNVLGDVRLLEARFDAFEQENAARRSYGYGIAAATVTSAVAAKIGEYIKEQRTLILLAMQVSTEALPQSFIAGLANGGDLTSGPRAVLAAAQATVSGSFTAIRITALITQAAAEITKAVLTSQLETRVRQLEQVSDLNDLRTALERSLRQQEARVLDVEARLAALGQAQDHYRAVLAKGQRLLDERTSFRARAAEAIQSDRYADLVFRASRNDALGRYHTAFDLAARYAYLAAQAYAYETGLSGSSTNGSAPVLETIVRARSLGAIEDGQPLTGAAEGDPGLADALARLDANWTVLRGRLGFNNPAREGNQISLRAELFRIGTPVDPAARASSDEAWRNALRQCRVDNLLELPEFRRYCLPFFPVGATEPALVIPFATTIESRKNVFGWDLAGGDHAFDSSHFATKIRAVGVWFANFNTAFQGGLGFTPRVYLIPAGHDLMREPGEAMGATRVWRVVDQALPLPFNVWTGQLEFPDWLPIIDGLTESFGTLRKFPSMRAYHDAGQFTASELVGDSRLVGRSVWNTRWLLIIPASTLHSDSQKALEWFIEGAAGDGNGVQDIKLMFQTYSNSGN